jgi:hypothetical protein
MPPPKAWEYPENRSNHGETGRKRKNPEIPAAFLPSQPPAAEAISGFPRADLGAAGNFRENQTP